MEEESPSEIRGGGQLIAHSEQFTFAMTEKHTEASSTMYIVELPIPQQAKDIIKEQYENDSLTIFITPRVFTTEYHGFISFLARNDIISRVNTSKVLITGTKHGLQYASSSLGVNTTDNVENRRIKTGEWLMSGYYYALQVQDNGTVSIRGALNYVSWETGDWDMYVRWVDVDS